MNKVNQTKYKEIVFDGKKYSTVTECIKSLGISTTQFYKKMKSSDHEDCYYVEHKNKYVECASPFCDNMFFANSNKMSTNQKFCSTACRRKYNHYVQNKPWKLHKKDHCEMCGPKVNYHNVQLHVHHIDCSKENNDISNLMTLCANCHSLITHLESGHLNKNNVPKNVRDIFERNLKE